MLKRYFKKREIQKIKLQRAYDKGYARAEQHKDEDIKKLRIKFGAVIKGKNELISKMQKKINTIEDSLNRHSDIISQTNMILKKIQSNSYAESMLAQTEHQKVETMNDEVELLNIRMNKSRKVIDGKIIEFKRIVNE